MTWKTIWNNRNLIAPVIKISCMRFIELLLNKIVENILNKVQRKCVNRKVYLITYIIFGHTDKPQITRRSMISSVGAFGSIFETAPSLVNTADRCSFLNFFTLKSSFLCHTLKHYIKEFRIFSFKACAFKLT